jgi:hypothetical protein
LDIGDVTKHNAAKAPDQIALATTESNKVDLLGYSITSREAATQ